MTEKDQILKLFPQPVFKFKVKDHENINSNLLKYIYDLQKKDPIGVKKSNINGWHSQPFDLSDPENLTNKFFKSIDIHIQSVFKSYGWLFDQSKVICTSMWAIINKKNSFNIEHTHSNNYLSAAYYVKAPENSGNFKTSNPNIISRNIYPKPEKPTEFNSNNITIKINEGDLLIFPAYLPHSVEENKSNEDRVIISFNLDILR
jgi:uncharacterized protein (TIGR02466 family)